MDLRDSIKIVLFCGLLVAPLVSWILQLNPPFDVVYEGREAEVAPSIKWRDGRPTMSSISSFPGALDRYLTDQMPFRRAVVSLQRRLRFQGHILTLEELSRTTGKSPGNVLLGKQSWTYYTGDKTLLQVQGRHPFTPAELENWRNVLQERTDYLRQRGIRYVILHGPDKPTIYPEYLPDQVRPSRGPSRLDQLYAYLKTHSTVEFVDVRPALRTAKKSHLLFYPNDTHWNDAGALVATRCLLQTLGRPTERCDFTQFIENPNGVAVIGELTSLGCPQPQAAIELVPRFDRQHARPPRNQWWKSRTATIENPTGEGRAIVFHDSFFVWMEPFFSESFAHTRYIVNDGFNLDLIAAERPDVVVEEWVERSLNRLHLKRLPPAVLAAQPKTSLR